MPKYVVLLNFTEEGARNIRQQPAQRAALRERLRALGVTRDFYLTMGPYDAVVLADAPDDETLARVVLTVGSAGNFRTLTMKAFAEDEADQIIGGMPPAS